MSAGNGRINQRIKILKGRLKMIKLEDNKKSNLELQIDEAKIEEAIAKWEEAKVTDTLGDDEVTNIKGER